MYKNKNTKQTNYSNRYVQKQTQETNTLFKTKKRRKQKKQTNPRNNKNKKYNNKKHTRNRSKKKQQTRAAVVLWRSIKKQEGANTSMLRKEQTQAGRSSGAGRVFQTPDPLHRVGALDSLRRLAVGRFASFFDGLAFAPLRKLRFLQKKNIPSSACVCARVISVGSRLCSLFFFKTNKTEDEHETNRRRNTKQKTEHETKKNNHAEHKTNTRSVDAA